MPLVCAEVDWLIPSRDAQCVFVWRGMGSVADNKLCLVSLACSDRMCLGMDWNQALCSVLSKRFWCGVLAVPKCDGQEYLMI